MSAQMEPQPDTQAQQAPSMRAPKRLPLVTQFSNRDDTFLKDARLVNAIAEKYPDGESYKVQKRPGLAPTSRFSSLVSPQGMYFWQYSITNSSLIVIGDGGIYIASYSGFPIPRWSLTLLTTITGSNPFWFCPVPAAAPLLVLGAGVGGNGTESLGYYYNPATSTVGTITDANFPTNRVPGFVYLDGTIYVMDTTGLIWNTENEDDPTVWGALNNISAKGLGDIPIALTSQLTYVVALKQYSTLFFYDAGNPTASPLAPVPGALLNYGCLSANTVQSIDGILFWVTASLTQSCQVIKLDDLQEEIISTPQIDKLLSSINVNTFSGHYIPDILSSFSFKYAGHRYYGITDQSLNFTLVYDIDQKLWYQWTDVNGNYYPVNSVTSNVGGGASLLAQLFTGGLYVLAGDWEYSSDLGVVVPLDIYTPNYDAGIDRIKMLSQMRFNADQVPAGLLLVRSSDDDYQTWSSWREVDMSDERPTLNDEGSFYRRAYNFRYAANTKFRISSVDLQMDIGTL